MEVEASRVIAGDCLMYSHLYVYSDELPCNRNWSIFSVLKDGDLCIHM